jgi:hypothetical protein
MVDGKIYIIINTKDFPDGEKRGYSFVGMLTCPICGNNFVTLKTLNWHKETDHDVPKSPPGHNR